ncbi:MAG: hypothetical protein BMS9Abin13_613 [Patescibacteria group bacterium]|nr:MAG: hypothetical protein BMS9Abin13_613 [Patescibacteria group bacterium]
MTTSKSILSILLAILLSGGVVGGYKLVRDNRADTFENSLHTAMRVIDGDTIDIGNKKRIRLLGIDAPERGECYYDQSLAFLEELVENKDIRIEKDISGVDRYDRYLRYIYIPADAPEEDDVFVNNLLVRQGYAFTFAIAPDNRYRDLLASAQEEAKKEERGLWGACDYEERDTQALRENDTLPPNNKCTIKGNISEKGYGKNYFFEGCPNYNRIKIDLRKGEQYFCTESEAQKAGFARSASCDNTF